MFVGVSTCSLSVIVKLSFLLSQYHKVSMFVRLFQHVLFLLLSFHSQASTSIFQCCITWQNFKSRVTQCIEQNVDFANEALENAT